MLVKALFIVGYLRVRCTIQGVQLLCTTVLFSIWTTYPRLMLWLTSYPHSKMSFFAGVDDIDLLLIRDKKVGALMRP